MNEQEESTELAKTDFATMTTPELEKLCTNRERVFAREFVIRGDATKAVLFFDPKYTLADSTDEDESKRIRQRASIAGWKLKKKQHVQALIDRYNEEAAEAVGITKASQLQDLQDVFELARRKNEPGAMVSAKAEQNRMLGFHAPTKFSDPDGKPITPITAIQINVIKPKHDSEN